MGGGAAGGAGGSVAAPGGTAGVVTAAVQGGGRRGGTGSRDGVLDSIGREVGGGRTGSAATLGTVGNPAAVEVGSTVAEAEGRARGTPCGIGGDGLGARRKKR